MKSLTKLFYVLLIVTALMLTSNPQMKALALDKFDQYFYPSVCASPIHYKLGSIDPKFGLSEGSFLSDTKETAKIWDKASGGEQLFVFDPTDSQALTINLVYDSRSALSNQISSMEGNVNQKNQNLQPQIDSYEQEVTSFKQKSADFAAAVDALNKEIEYYNSQGGAPPDKYQELNQKQQDLKNQQASLQAEADKLNSEAQSLNLSTQDYNASVNNLNQTIGSFNEALSQKPEEGLFDPNSNKIDIYFNNDSNELIHTITHEMGHALGMGHNQDKASIMYPYSNKDIIPTQEDIDALKAVCRQRHLSLPFIKALPINLTSRI